MLTYELYIIYQNMPRQPKALLVEQKNSDLKPENIISNVMQFSENMRFNHNTISYNIASDCSPDEKLRMESALLELSTKTQIISFKSGDENSDILISCSEIKLQKDENIFIAGEGGPSRYINNTIYPVILRGRILLYSKSNCQSSLVEMHELLHVFGFDHSQDDTDLMFPRSDCSQELKQKYINKLKELYLIKPLAELYFKDIDNITRSGKYLSFKVTIVNKGILDATDVNLSVYAEDEKLNSFDLGDINLGEGQKFTIENLKLPSLDTQEILLRIESKNEEYDYENNVLKASG